MGAHPLSFRKGPYASFQQGPQQKKGDLKRLRVDSQEKNRMKYSGPIYAIRLFIPGEHFAEPSSMFKVNLNRVPNPFEWLKTVKRVFADNKDDPIPFQGCDNVMHVIKVFWTEKPQPPGFLWPLMIEINQMSNLFSRNVSMGRSVGKFAKMANTNAHFIRGKTHTSHLF